MEDMRMKGRAKRDTKDSAPRSQRAPRRVLVIDGHPDADRHRLVHALADAYAEGAATAGHEVRRIDIATLELASLRGNDDFLHGTPSPVIERCQQDLAWCSHVALLFPLWLGDMPGLLKILLEQVARPGFAFATGSGKGLPRKLLRGRSARIVVTMGMPAFFYRWYYRGHSVKSLERNILAFVGIAPVRRTLLGMVEGGGDAKRVAWLAKLRELGTKAG
jgi:putative NADPH-quinone reductase